MINSYEYLKRNKLMSWDNYPYETKIGTCRYKPTEGVASVSSYKEIPGKNPLALMDAVAK
jgi:hypothetical protein